MSKKPLFPLRIPPLSVPPRSVTIASPVSAQPTPKSGLVGPGTNLDDDKVKGISKRLVAGYSETIGTRKKMEDKLVIYGTYRTKDDEDYFAVFDGHNGDTAAKYCASRLHVKLAEKLDAVPDTVTCFRETFVESNTLLKSTMKQGEEFKGGTTALIALFKGNELYIANAGDSRAVISHQKKAKRITTDHKPELPEEKERIERAGGFVDHKGTVTGTLSVSRSLGDFSYHPFVTCEPDVFGPFHVFDTNQNYQLLILACDGLWDVVKDEDAVAIALRASNPEEAARKLREKASAEDSKDNISVVVIFFPHYKPNSSRIPTADDASSSTESINVRLSTDDSENSNGEKQVTEKHEKRRKSAKRVNSSNVIKTGSKRKTSSSSNASESDNTSSTGSTTGSTSSASGATSASSNSVSNSSTSSSKSSSSGIHAKSRVHSKTRSLHKTNEEEGGKRKNSKKDDDKDKERKLTVTLSSGTKKDPNIESSDSESTSI